MKQSIPGSHIPLEDIELEAHGSSGSTESGHMTGTYSPEAAAAALVSGREFSFCPSS